MVDLLLFLLWISQYVVFVAMYVGDGNYVKIFPTRNTRMIIVWDLSGFFECFVEVNNGSAGDFI